MYISTHRNTFNYHLLLPLDWNFVKMSVMHALNSSADSTICWQLLIMWELIGKLLTLLLVKHKRLTIFQSFTLLANGISLRSDKEAIKQFRDQSRLTSWHLFTRLHLAKMFWWPTHSSLWLKGEPAHRLGLTYTKCVVNKLTNNKTRYT